MEILLLFLGGGGGVENKAKGRLCHPQKNNPQKKKTLCTICTRFLFFKLKIKK
jgi:hypothetical protein